MEEKRKVLEERIKSFIGETQFFRDLKSVIVKLSFK